jgi:hypothetical protein
MRRRRSPLLVACLGLLAAAAPAAHAAARGEEREPDAPAKPGREEGERKAAGAKAPVLLRSVPEPERQADPAPDGCPGAADLPPAVHPGGLDAPKGPPAADRPRRDDLRAGLLAIPPPAA